MASAITDRRAVSPGTCPRHYCAMGCGRHRLASLIGSADRQCPGQVLLASSSSPLSLLRGHRRTIAGSRRASSRAVCVLLSGGIRPGPKIPQGRVRHPKARDLAIVARPAPGHRNLADTAPRISAIVGASGIGKTAAGSPLASSLPKSGRHSLTAFPAWERSATRWPPASRWRPAIRLRHDRPTRCAWRASLSRDEASRPPRSRWPERMDCFPARGIRRPRRLR